MKNYQFLIIALPLYLDIACNQTLSSKNAQPIMIDKCDTIVTMEKNGSAIIQLPLISSTGFTWLLAEKSDVTVLEKISDKEDITPLEKNDKDGNTEIQTFNLKATQKEGSTVLTFHYKMSFEKDKAPLKICQITIVVK